MIDNDRSGSLEQPAQAMGALTLLVAKTLFGCVLIGSAAVLVPSEGLDFGYAGSNRIAVLVVLVVVAAMLVGEFALSLAAVIILLTGRSRLAWRALVAVCVALLVENVVVTALQILTWAVSSGSMPDSKAMTVLVIWSAVTIGALALILTRPVQRSFVPDPPLRQPSPAAAISAVSEVES